MGFTCMGDSAHRELARVGEPGFQYEKKVVSPAWANPAAEARQLMHPSCLAPIKGFRRSK